VVGKHFVAAGYHEPLASKNENINLEILGF